MHVSCKYVLFFVLLRNKIIQLFLSATFWSLSLMAILCLLPSTQFIKNTCITFINTKDILKVNNNEICPVVKQNNF